MCSGVGTDADVVLTKVYLSWRAMLYALALLYAQAMSVFSHNSIKDKSAATALPHIVYFALYIRREAKKRGQTMADRKFESVPHRVCTCIILIVQENYTNIEIFFYFILHDTMFFYITISSVCFGCRFVAKYSWNLIPILIRNSIIFTNICELYVSLPY